MDAIIEFITQPSTLELISKQNELLAVYLIGSRCLEITDEHSDYDLIALVSKPVFENPEDRLKDHIEYNGAKIHWYYFTYDELFDKDNLVSLTAGKLELPYAKVLYCKNEAVVKQIEETKQNIIVPGLCVLYSRFQALINKIIEANTIADENKTKFIYHLCWASCYIDNAPFDKEKLTHLKRMRYQEISEADIRYAIERLKIFKEWMKTNLC